MFRQQFFLILLCMLLAVGGALSCASAPPVPPPTQQFEQARQAARNDPGPVNAAARRLFEEGVRSYQAGAWAEAADLFGQAADVGIIHFPQRPDARVYQCLSLMHLQRFQDAYKIASEATQEYPDRWELRLVLVEYLLYRERPDMAREQLNAAYHLAPFQPEVLRAQVKTALAENDLVAAEEFARLTFSQQPDNPLYRQLLADICLQRAKALMQQESADVDQTLGLLFEAATHDPKNPDPPFLLGRLAISLNEIEAARRFAARGRTLLSDQTKPPREALFVDDESSGGAPGVHHRKAEEYLREGQPAFAAEELERELSVSPENTVIWAKLGALAAELDDEQRALECLYALWVLQGNSDYAVELEQTLQLSFAERPASPGFVVRSEVGTAWDTENNKMTSRGNEFAANQRVYFSLVLGNAVGRHQICLVVTDPTGHRAIDETVDVEFFGVEFALLRSGSWFTVGEWKVEWTMDGAPRANTSFRLR